MGKIYDLYWDNLAEKFNNGDDLDFSEDELLDNPKFIKALLRRDKKAYIYMSDRLKDDYEFIRSLVIENTDDFELIYPIIDEYVKRNYLSYTMMPNDESGKVISIGTETFLEQDLKNANCHELYAIATKGMEALKCDDDKRIRYAIEVSAYYENIKEEVMHLIELKKLKNEYGLGFCVHQMMYENNPHLLEYFAKRLVLDIDGGDYDCLSREEKAHILYSNSNEFVQGGKNEFLSKMVAPHDKTLSYYVSGLDYDILPNLDDSIKSIAYNWYVFEDKNANEKVNEFVKRVKEAIEDEHIVDLYFFDLAYYLEHTYRNAQDLFENEYYSLTEELNDSQIEMEMTDYSFMDAIDSKSLSIDDYKKYKVMLYAEELVNELSKKRILCKCEDLQTYKEFKELNFGTSRTRKDN